MALGFRQEKEDVAALIAKKNYGRAIEVIREQLKTQKQDPRLRLQLADVLISAGKGQQAIAILEPLADEYAREGFAAKSISVLKKIQKIDPSRRDINAKLAGLIEEKQRLASASVPSPGPSAGGFEIGMEAIGFEAPSGGAISVPSDSGPSLDLGFGGTPVSVPSPVAYQPPPELEAPEAPAPVEDQDLLGMDGLEMTAESAGGESGLALESEPLALEQDADLGALQAEPGPAPEPPAAAELAPDFLPAPELVMEPEPEPGILAAPELLEPEPEVLPEPELLPELEPAPEEVADPMTDSAFADELLSVLEEAFPSGMDVGPPQPAEREEGDGGSQIVVSPLFKDFSVDELVAVIQGLKLLSFEPGSIILTEGDPGDSMYMLTSGTVKALKKDPAGRQTGLGQLEEGSFFGEVSILTGKPRTATIVALTQCELLELDRPTLTSIVQQHPHVKDVLVEFARARMKR